MKLSLFVELLLMVLLLFLQLPSQCVSVQLRMVNSQAASERSLLRALERHHHHQQQQQQHDDDSHDDAHHHRHPRAWLSPVSASRILRRRECPNQCSRLLGSFRGECVAGHCVCGVGFYGLDCSLPGGSPLSPGNLSVQPGDYKLRDRREATAECTNATCSRNCAYGGWCTSSLTCKCNSHSLAPPAPPAGSVAAARATKRNVDEPDTFLHPAKRDGIHNSSGNVFPPYAGTRSAVFPLLKSKQQSALATLLRRVSGRRPPAPPPRIDSCAVKAIVCDTDGNVVEVNHELAQIASGQIVTTRGRTGASRRPSSGSSGSGGSFMLDGASLLKLPFLRSVELNACRLQGTLPPQVGSLQDMTSILLFDNQLTGSLPSSIGSLVNLRTLVVSSNKFRGELPASLAQSRQIEHLDAAFNSFHGPFPEPVAEGLVALNDIRLNDNHLDQVPEPTDFYSLKVYRTDHNDLRTAQRVEPIPLQKHQANHFTDFSLNEVDVVRTV